MTRNGLVLRRLGRSDLSIAPLVIGGNVFGWTVPQAVAFQLLDHFIDSGFGAVDTADIYSNWIPGNGGGESETMIGNWIRTNPAKRNKLVVITKVGGNFSDKQRGLSTNAIITGVEGSLRRLKTDYIDVYLSHFPDPDTPIEETLRAHESLVKQGKVRVIGASNYNSTLLQEAMTAAGNAGLPRYEVIQPEYNLYDRDSFESDLRDFALGHELGVITYFSLASGFLSGKYRSKDDLANSARGSRVAKYLNPRGMEILKALDSVAREHDSTPAEIAIAWLIVREGVSAPIVSATSLTQLDSLINATRITLNAEDLRKLDQAGCLPV